MHIQVALLLGMQIGHALASEPEDFSSLRGFGNRDARLRIHRRHGNFAAQSRRCKTDRQIRMQVVAVSLEDIMRLDEHLHIQIAVGPAIEPRFSASLNANALSVIDARWNIDFKRLRLPYAANALTIRARIRNDLTRTMTVRTGLLHLQEAAIDVDRTAAAAMRARLFGGAGLAAGSVAALALFPNRHTNVGLGAVHSLLKRNLKRIADIIAAKNLRTAARALAAAAAEDFRKNVAKIRKSALLAETAEAAEAACACRARINARLAVAVISRTFLGIREHGIGFAHLLELFLSGLVAVVAVRVVLHRQTAIRLFDFVFRGTAGYSEYLVIVLISHRSVALKYKQFEGRKHAKAVSDLLE